MSYLFALQFFKDMFGMIGRRKNKEEICQSQIIAWRLFFISNKAGTDNFLIFSQRSLIAPIIGKEIKWENYLFKHICSTALAIEPIVCKLQQPLQSVCCKMDMAAWRHDTISIWWSRL